jgi:hypothetical protein
VIGDQDTRTGARPVLSDSTVTWLIVAVTLLALLLAYLIATRFRI